MATEKKNDKERSVEERLQNLYQLQSYLSEIDRIKILRGELPNEVKDLEDEIIRYQTRIQKYKDEIEELKNLVAQKKGDINERRIKIEKYEEQINNVRNNREYDALNKEVEFQKLEIELQQKRIRETQKSKTEKEEALEIASRQYDEKKADLDAKKAELEDIIAETHKDEEELTNKSEQLSKNIEERLLTAYKRIRGNARNGLAVVTVDRDACGGCFNNIPPQRQLDIRSRKKIIVCEYCGRILIDKYICDYDGSQQKADLESAMESQKKKGRRSKKSEE